jgi:hypothetical protein
MNSLAIISVDERFGLLPTFVLIRLIRGFSALFRRFTTFGTGAPIDHLRFVDQITGVTRGGQAGGLAHGAIDVDRLAACATNEMVVIIADAVFIASRRTGRLNPADEALLGQHAEGVVHRLARDRAEFGADHVGNIIRRRVRPCGYRANHGQPLGGDLEAFLTQKLGRVAGHARDST